MLVIVNDSWCCINVGNVNWNKNKVLYNNITKLKRVMFENIHNEEIYVHARDCT